MQQPPQPQHPQQPEMYAAPQQPMPVAYAAPIAAPPAPVMQETTIRAQIAPAIPTWEPRPWGDTAPVSHASPAHAPVSHASPAHAPVAAPTYQPVLPAPPLVGVPAQIPAPQQFAPAAAIAMPVYAPFAAAPAPVAAGQPLQYAAPAVSVAMPLQPATAMPVVAPVQRELPAPAPIRSHSLAPQGMGSTLRLDDPSLSDVMTRARSERTELAKEYRRHSAPLVQIGEPHAVHQTQVLAQQPAPDGLQLGHDPQGMPLFAAPGSATVQPIAQYPEATHVPPMPGAMPRPVVVAPNGEVDPALRSSAFQRRTPYAPLEPAAVPVQPHAHA